MAKHLHFSFRFGILILIEERSACGEKNVIRLLDLYIACPDSFVGHGNRRADILGRNRFGKAGRHRQRSRDDSEQQRHRRFENQRCL